MNLGDRIMKINDFWRKRSIRRVNGITWLSIGDYLLHRGVYGVKRHWELFLRIWNYCNNSKDVQNCMCIMLSGHDGPLYSFAVNKNFDFLKALEHVGEKIRREFFVNFQGLPIPVIHEQIVEPEITTHKIIAFGQDSSYSESLDVAINRIVDHLFPDPAERIEIRKLLREALTSSIFTDKRL